MASYAITGDLSGGGSLSGDVEKAKLVSSSSITGTGTLSVDLSEISYKRNIVGGFSGSIVTTLNEFALLIHRSQVWWNKSYTYRRVLQLQPTDRGIPQGHPLKAVVGLDLVRQDKLRPDLADIEVLRLVSDVPETWEILPNKIDVFDSYIEITWPNAFDVPQDQIIADIYYIYYGNFNLLDKPEDNIYNPPEWPMSVPYADGRITYTRPGEHWENGIANTLNAKATFIFYGPKVRILSDIGNSWGIFEAQIDDDPWEVVDLYSPQSLEEQEVYKKEGLSTGSHTLRIRTTQNSHPSSADTAINFKKIEYQIHSTLANLYEEADETLMWGSVIGGVVG